MNKGASILIIVFFSMALVGLLVFGLVKVFGVTNLSGGKPKPNPNSTAPTTQIANEDLQKLAANFNESFTSWFFAKMSRCSVIEQANSLNDGDLKTLNAIYISEYGYSMKSVMDNALEWCYSSTDDQDFYDRLKTI